MRNKFIKIGAKVVRHGRYVTFHLAEVAMQNAKQEINRLRQTNVLMDADCLIGTNPSRAAEALMVPNRTTRGLYLFASTSILALGLAAAPVMVDFDLDRPVLKVAQADGGSGSGGEGGEGGEGGDGGSGGEGGEGGDGGDNSGPGSANSGRGGGVAGEASGAGSSGPDSASASAFGGLDQVGPDLSQDQEADAISNGWQ
jgi:hypothetical protein